MVDNRLLDGRVVRDRILDGVAARVHAGAAKHALGHLREGLWAPDDEAPTDPPAQA